MEVALVRRRALCLGLLLFAGCTHVRPHFTSLNFDAATMELLGPARGVASQAYLFGMGPIGLERELAIAAVADALKTTIGDALVGIVADERVRVDLFGLYFRRTVEVRGQAVRFKAGPRGAQP